LGSEKPEGKGVSHRKGISEWEGRGKKKRKKRISSPPEIRDFSYFSALSIERPVKGRKKGVPLRSRKKVFPTRP